MENKNLIGISGYMTTSSYRKNIVKLLFIELVVFLFAIYISLYYSLSIHPDGDFPSSEFPWWSIFKVNPFAMISSYYGQEALMSQNCIFFFSTPVLVIFYFLNIRRFRDIYGQQVKWLRLRSFVTIIPLAVYFASKFISNFLPVSYTAENNFQSALYKVAVFELIWIGYFCFWEKNFLNSKLGLFQILKSKFPSDLFKGVRANINITNSADELMKLNKLHQDGVITKEEFDQLKSKILNS